MEFSAESVIAVVGLGYVGLPLTFKENCPDLRNSKVIDMIDIITELKDYGLEVMAHDPRVNPEDARRFFGIELCGWKDMRDLGALIFAVPHRELLTLRGEMHTALAANGCLTDVKSALDIEDMEKLGINYWRL